MSRMLKRILCICLCMIFFVQTSFAQVGNSLIDETAADKIKADYDASTPIKPKGISGIDAAKLNKQLFDKVTAMMNRTAEESIYYSRGVTMDFMNKPINLFKLTCTDSSIGGAKTKSTIGFDFSKNVWKQFCANKKFDTSKSGLAQAAKCIFQQIMQEQFQGVTANLDKFKSQSFCEAFTKFVSNQIDQCITIRFNVPRGQYPGFPALGQCLFGRLNLDVNNLGNVYVKGNAGQVLTDIVSTHGYQYAPVGPSSPNGFGGSEQQLLGDDGAASVMDITKWKQDAQLTALQNTNIATASCQNPDPVLSGLLDKWRVKNNLLIRGISPVIGVNSEGEERVVAYWGGIEEFNEKTKTYDAKLTSGGDLTFTPEGWTKTKTVLSAGAWTADPAQYSYLASCYGLILDLEDTTCKSIKDASGTELSESYKQMCAARDTTVGCCNPDDTDCLGAGLLWRTDVCRIDPKTGKEDPRKTDGTCEIYQHLVGDGKMCDGACCNPSLNDCVKLNMPICDKYIPPKQCLTATPEQLREYNPIYSKIRPKPDNVIDGHVCCTTEWCDVCPQDVFVAYRGFATWNGGANGTMIVPQGAIPMPGKACFSRPGNPSMVVAPSAVIQAKLDACGRTGLGNGLFAVGNFLAGAFSGAISVLSGNITGVASQISPERMNEIDMIKAVTGVGVSDYQIKFTCDDFPQGLWDIPNFEMPITKLPKLEGADPVGLCSELPLCPLAVPDDQNPLSFNGKLTPLAELLKSGGGQTKLKSIFNILNGTNDPLSLHGKLGRIGGSTLPINLPGGNIIRPYTPATDLPVTDYPDDDPTKGGTVKSCYNSEGFLKYGADCPN